MNLMTRLMAADHTKVMKWGFRIWIGMAVISLCAAAAVVYVAAHFIMKAW